jgi:histidinol phosphatase-like enzyme (inositol monophosphatase family)
MNSPELTAATLEPFFDELARLSGEAIMPYFRMQPAVADKTPGQVFDPVTEADRAAERVIRAHIKKHFPDHAIRGEEFGRENTGAEYEWVIDPIDGTRGFICGLPTWGTLVGLQRNGIAVFGMMNQPHVGECFTGDGKISRVISTSRTQILKTRILKTRDCLSLGDAFIATTSPRIIKGEESLAYDRLEARCKLARYGGDCYAYAALAAGQIDLVVETGLQAYDIAALIPIIEGAGGIVTTWTGGSPAEGGSILAAGNKALHSQAMDVLSGY